MDTRSEQEKIGDMVECYEHPEKVIVVAPTHRMAQEWGLEHDVKFSRVVFVGPSNYTHVMRGLRGVPHVILRWDMFTPEVRGQIRADLQIADSPPWQDNPAHVPEPADLRTPGVG